MSATVFDLPPNLTAKSSPALIAADESHFARITAALERAVDDVTTRLDAARRAPGGRGQQALDRDQEVHRLTARLNTLQRYGVDLCLGRVVHAEESHPLYIGRLGLTDDRGHRLLVDWRSPAAEPFFAATHARPAGLVSRRRYHWTRGRITDYWDEVFATDALDDQAALDDQSAFIASLGAHRSERMRDVLGTIQADQDAIIRAGARGTLVVDGGPGTGKTVVALHRTAYLLYSDPLLGHRRGGVLFVGPSRPYLTYVSDVLPSLGEEGVRTAILADLVPEGAGAGREPDPEVAALKATRALVAAIEPAVRFHEEPPTVPMEVATAYGDFWVGVADWADAFDSPAPGTPHNEAREEVWEELLDILLDKYEGDDDIAAVRAALAGDRDLAEAFARAWPLIEPGDLVGDLWTVPAYLRRCAPHLDPDQVRLLQRDRPDAWTTADLPLLDAARLRLGDPEAARHRRRRAAAAASETAERQQVVDHLIASDDSEMMLMSMLRGADLRNALTDADAVAPLIPDDLAGPFAHIVVDEAQELTDAEWQMLLGRCPSRSFTVVGDRAQARHGFVESWEERLSRVGLDRVEHARLRINYRTPAEVMAAAEPVIRVALPDANVPESVRSTGVPVRYGRVGDLEALLSDWLSGGPEGLACVIGGPSPIRDPRIRALDPVLAKGLEFDLVVLIDPESFGEGIEGAVDRYVAMTRATQRLVVLTS